MSTASELLIEQSGDVGGVATSGGATSGGAPARDSTQTQDPEPGMAGFNPNLGSESKAPIGGWLQTVADPELREFIRNKGWNEPAAMAVGYRHLENLIGGEKVPVPKGESDTEGWERVYKALGRPATPEDYKLVDLESAAQYHKLGLTARQASGLSAWQDSLKAAQEQRGKNEAGLERAQQLAVIRKEWAGEFDENVRLGKRAVREFGLEGSVEKLEAALGSGELLKLTVAGPRTQGRHVCRRCGDAYFWEDEGAGAGGAWSFEREQSVCEEVFVEGRGSDETLYRTAPDRVYGVKSVTAGTTAHYGAPISTNFSPDSKRLIATRRCLSKICCREASLVFPHVNHKILGGLPCISNKCTKSLSLVRMIASTSFAA